MGVFYIFLFPLVLIIFIKKYAFVPLVKCSKMACLWDFLKIPTKGKVIVLRTGYNYDMERRVQNLESDDSIKGSSNFKRFLKYLESDNSSWIEEINKRLLTEAE